MTMVAMDRGFFDDLVALEKKLAEIQELGRMMLHYGEEIAAEAEHKREEIRTLKENNAQRKRDSGR